MVERLRESFHVRKNVNFCLGVITSLYMMTLRRSQNVCYLFVQARIGQNWTTRKFSALRTALTLSSPVVFTRHVCSGGVPEADGGKGNPYGRQVGGEKERCGEEDGCQGTVTPSLELAGETRSEC